MSDLRSAFLSKDFVVNSNIVKCISNIDITLDIRRNFMLKTVRMALLVEGLEKVARI